MMGAELFYNVFAQSASCRWNKRIHKHTQIHKRTNTMRSFDVVLYGLCPVHPLPCAQDAYIERSQYPNAHGFGHRTIDVRPERTGLTGLTGQKTSQVNTPIYWDQKRRRSKRRGLSILVQARVPSQPQHPRTKPHFAQHIYNISICIAQQTHTHLYNSSILPESDERHLRCTR